MGKKRVCILGSENEEQTKAKETVKREQKKLRQGKAAKAEETTPEPVTIAESQEQPATSKLKKTKVRSKAYQSAKNSINPLNQYSISEALKLLRQVSLTKFDPTVELHLTLKDKMSSQTIDLPHATGKTRRVAIADDETIANIEAGKIDFDILIASPAQMGKLVKYAKILGPKGLMPNPKNGTVVDDPEAAAKKLAGANSLTLKTEKDTPVVHTIVGKLSMNDEQLTSNVNAVMSTMSTKTKKAVIKSTMSPGIKLQTS